VSALKLYRIEPVAADAWPACHIAAVEVFGLCPAKQVALNLLTDDHDWNHTIRWHQGDDRIWRLCVEPRWGTHNTIAQLFKVKGGGDPS
jgi:hypothetical protein